MKKALSLLFWAFLAEGLMAQTGTEFWVAPPDVTYYHNAPGDQPIYLNVTSGNAAATVTISQPANAAFNGGTPIVLNLAANSAVRYDLSSLKVQLETRPTNSVRNTGLFIESTADITAYYEVSNTNNPDILALKGANGLGTEFYIPLHKHAPFYNHNFSPNNADLAFASFDIVATENNTTVLIYSPVAVDGHAALVPFTIVLNRGQTYSCANTSPTTHFDPATHPSGAVVLSDKPVAVSLKDDSNHNPSGGCYDLMLDQIVPVNILGTDYVAVKGALNSNGDESMFIMAVQNNTQVYVDGSATPVTTLFAGQYYRHDMDYLSGAADNSTYISASKPVYAIHVTGFGCEQGMAIMPPLNCAGSSQLSFTRSTSEAFYLNLLVRNGSEDDFVVAGPGTATIPAAAFQTVPGTGGEWMAARIQYNTTQVPVNQAFIVTNATNVFSLAIINGGATSGCRYGFFSEFSGKIVVDAGVDQNLCADDVVELNGSVSGGSTTGIWTSTGSGTFLPNDTDLDATYEPSVGDLALGTVTLTLTSTGNCTPEDDQLVVNFAPMPIAEAGAPISSCSNAPNVPLAGSILNAVGGVWTGGSGVFLPSNSNLNATYTPTAAEVSGGSLTIYLTTTGNGVCPAVTDSVLVTFTPAPTANAGPDGTRCANAPALTLNGSFTVATGGVWSGGNGTFDPSTTNMNAIYTPTAAEIANGSVTLTLTTTGNGNCNAVSDQMTITFTPAPTADAGGAVTVCANNSAVALGGSVTVATGGVWSGGTGSFSPSNTTLNATYTPTSAEIAAGTLQLTLTTTGNGNCNAVSDLKTINITPAPTVDAGAGSAVCANNASIVLNGTVNGATGGIWSGGSGSYAPNNTTLNATYSPSPAELTAGTVTLTLTSVGNGNCNAVNDQVTYTITPAPTVNAGSDQVLCSNNSVATLNGSFTVATGVVWSGGAGSFDPSTTNSNSTYTPTATEIANGSVTLTLTTTGNGNCVAVSDQMTISFTASPTANAGADVSLCANNPQIALSGSTTLATGAAWTGGTGSFNPNNTSLNATYTPTAAEIAAGTLTLTLTTTGNGDCNAVSDQKVITFTPAPIVDAGSNGTVCANASAIALSGSIVGATGGIWSGGGGSFSPNNTTLNATYTPTAANIAAGTVTLTLTSAGNGNCNAVSDQVTYSITLAPTVNAGSDQVLCSNNAVATLNGSFTVATGVIWSGGAGSFDPSTTNTSAIYTPTATEIANGSVTLTLTTTGNNNCVAVSDQMTISFTVSPTANAGADVSLCANNPQIALNGSITLATGAIWSGGTGSFNPNNTSLNATYSPTAAEIAAGTLTLTLTTTGNGDCNAASDQRTITFTPAPTVNAGANASVCANASSIALNGSVIGATGGIWSGGGGSYSPNNTTLNATYTPTAAEIAAGSVALTLTSAGNGNCNAVSDQVIWTITPAPTANAGSDQTLCSNNPVASLNGSFTVATGGVWSGGSGSFDPSTTNMNATYTPTAAEIANGSVTLTLTTTGNGNCVAVSDQKMITYTASPTVNAGADVSICENNPQISLNGSVGVASGGVWSGGGGSFLPNNTALNATYTPTAAEVNGGTLTLTLTTTGNGNCTAVSDQKTITFTPSPTVNAGANGTVCANASAITLNGSVAGATGGIWSGGGGSFTPNNTTLNATYTPTAAEIANGSVTLTLSSVGNGNCNAETDQVTWTITPAPTANAGADQVLCSNNATAVLGGSFTVATGGIWSGGNGTFDPSTTNMNGTYTPTADEIATGHVTLVLTTTGNGLCQAVTDFVKITYTPAPEADAGVDIAVCENNPSIELDGGVLIANGGIWSGGSGSFVPNNATLDATYNPTPAEIASGSLILTLTTTGNGNCIAVQDSRTITFTPAPTVNAGPNGVVCANAADITLSGSSSGSSGATWSGGTGSFSPNANTLNAVYSPSLAERNAGSVTLTLTTIGNGNCNAVSDQVTWTITPAPTANAGTDRVLCANAPEVNLSGSFSIASGGIWSGGNGTFDPSTTNMSAVYTPSSAEIANGSVTLTLTTTGNGLCNAVSDQVLLTFTDAPTANAGPDVTVCANNAQVALNGSVSTATGGTWSGGTGTYSPNASTLNATYSPGSADIAAGQVTLTLTTTGNGNCIPVTDTRTIFYTPSPIVDAGPNGTVCANAPQITLTGSVSGASGGVWSGGNGTFSPNNISLNATYTPSAGEITAGSVTLTLTTAGNGLCVAETDQVTYTITPAPTVNAGLDRTLCGNNASTVLNASISVATGVQWSGGTGAYSPSSTAQNITYSPSPDEIANGSVTLTVTTTGNGNCGAVSDNVTLTFTPAPIADAGPDQSKSSNNANTTLAGTFTVASGIIWSGGSGTYNPNNTTANAVYSPTSAEIAAGSVTLTMTTTGNGSCAPSSDQMTIVFTSAPTADAGPNQSTCANNASADLEGSVTVATGGIWSGGSGTYVPNNTSLITTYFPSSGEIAAGSVTLTLTTVGNGNSNPVSDQITITIDPAPVVNAGSNITVCANQPTAQLAGVVNNASGGVWSGGSGTFDPSTNNLNATYTPTFGEIAAGSVTLTLTSTGNGLCNAVADQVTISIAPSPVVSAGIDQTVCSNNPDIQLGGNVTNAGGGIWSGGTGGFSPSITALNAVYTPSTTELNNGSVTLTLTSTGNGSCTPVSDQIFIVFTQSPVANAGSDMTVCANDPTAQLNGNVSIAGGGVWSGGSGTFTPNNATLNATYEPSPAEVALGTVTLTLTTTQNGDCSSVSDQMTITINDAPVADAGDDLFVCSNNANVQLGGSVSGAGGGQWSGGAGTFTPSIASLNATYTPTPSEIAAGSLTLTLTTIGNGFCVPVTDQVLITFTASPTANAGSDGIRCANNADIQLNGSVTVANGGSWSGVQGTFSPNSNTLNAVYTPSQGELAAGSVTLTLTTTGNNGCLAVTDEVTFTFSPAPTANAGTDLVTCANNASVQLNGAITVATGALWSGGTGTYSPNTASLNATYVPSAAEIAAGTATLTLTTVGNGMCNPVSDQITITINPAPMVDPGAALQSCANNAAVQLAASVQNAGGGIWSGAGVFSPSTTQLNATYSPSATEIAAGMATITLTSTGNGLCNAVSEELSITITPAPIAEAGPAQTLCANNSNAQLNGSVTNANGGTWSGGSGTFAPGGSALNATYAPSSSEINAGGVWLTLTTTGNGACIATTDSVQLDYTPAPTANAGSDVHVCANDAIVDLQGSVTVATGGIWSGGSGTFSPSPNSLNATYEPTLLEIGAGELNLILTTTGFGNCAAVQDSMTIYFDPVPVVNAGPDQQICSNNPDISLNGFVGNAPGAIWGGGAGSFVPNNTSLAVGYEPTAAEIAAGSITLTLTSTGTVYCAPVVDEITIVFTGSPIVDAGEDQMICTNKPDVQLGGDVINASGGSWSGGSGTFTPSANVLSPVYSPTPSEIASGSVALTLTSTGNGNCFAEQDALTITFTPAPTVDAGVDLEMCMNDPVATLQGAVTIAGGGQWSGGAGVYTPNAQTLDAEYAPTTFELQSGSIQLTLTSTGNGNCLAVNDQVTLVVTPSPVVDAGPDITTCSNALQVPIEGSVTEGASSGIWSTSGTGSFFPNNTSLNTTYIASSLDSLNGSVEITLTSTNNGLCVAESDAMILTILPNAIAGAGPDQTICASDVTVQLGGSIVGNATEGTWTTTGSGSFQPDANSADAIYQVAAGDPDQGVLTFTWSVNSCDNAMDQMTVSITPVSEVNAGLDQVVCVDELDILINGSISGASSTGIWSSSGTGTFANGNAVLSNIYHASAQDSLNLGVDLVLTATNTSACVAAADTIRIDILPYGSVNAGPDVTLCANNADLQLNGVLNGDASEIQWTTSGTGSFYPNNTVLTPTYIPSAVDTVIGSVTLTLSATHSCNNASDALTLELTPAPYVNAGDDQTWCDQITQFDLEGQVSGPTTLGQWTTTGTGTIADPFSLNTTYSASPADIANGNVDFQLRSLDNDDCAQVIDAMTIWITDGITADAGPDQEVCVLSDYAQLQGAIINGSPTGTWTTTGTGTFEPGPDVLNAQYHFSSADVSNGSVVLTLTSTNNGTCVADQDQMVLTFGSTSFAYAGPDQVVCSNSPIIQLAGNFSGGASGSVWSTSGTGSFSNTTQPSATYALSNADITAGEVTLTLTTITDGTCATVSDEMMISVQVPPTINAGGDIIACTADEVQLIANAVNASAGTWSTSGTGTFLDPNALTTLYYPSAADSSAGSVTLTISTTGTAPCSSVSDAMLITFGGGLSAYAGEDVIACSTVPEIALEGTVIGTTTGIWSTTGTGSFTPSAIDLNATYLPGPADFVIGNIALVLTTTNNQGCAPGRDTLLVTYNVPPVVNAGLDRLLCDGLEDVQLAASVQHTAGIQWQSTGNGTFSPDATTLNATYTPTAADSIAGGVHLILTGIGNGICGDRTDSLFIDIGPTRIANAGVDAMICADESTIPLSGSITGVSGGTWSTSGTGNFLPDANTLNATYVPSNTDLVFPQLQFVLATTGNEGCPAATDTMIVSLQQPPTLDAGSDLNTCDATLPVDLSASFNNAGGVLWSTNGAGSFTADPASANTSYQPVPSDENAQQIQFMITTTGNGICPAAVDTLTLSFVNPLIANFTTGMACANAATTLTDMSSTTGSAIIGWNWTFGDGSTAAGPQTSYQFPSSGPHTVTLTVYAQNNCHATITQVVDVAEPPVAAFSVEGDLLTGSPIGITDLSQGATSWLYDMGDGNGSIVAAPQHIYADAGQYIIIQTVTNSAGCSDQDSLLIGIIEKDILAPKLPNAFSPNGDGVNDIFYVRGGPFKTMHLRIYNGWGEMIFETTDPEFGWDGSHKGRPEINGVYVYSVVAESTDGRTHDRTGKVTLMR